MITSKALPCEVKRNAGWLVYALVALFCICFVTSCAPTVPPGQDLYQNGRYSEAVNELTIFVRNNPDDAVGHFMLADALYLRHADNMASETSEPGDLHLAVFHFSRAIILHSRYSEAYSQRGVVRFALGDITGAKQDYDQAILLNPRLDRTYFNRGYWYESQLLTAEAIRDYEAYTSLSGDEVWKQEAERRLQKLRHSMKPNRISIPEDMVL